MYFPDKLIIIGAVSSVDESLVIQVLICDICWWVPGCCVTVVWWWSTLSVWRRSLPAAPNHSTTNSKRSPAKYVRRL